MDDMRQMLVFKILSDMRTDSIDKLTLKSILDRNLEQFDIKYIGKCSGETDIYEKIEMFLNIKTLDGMAKSSLKMYKQELRQFAQYMKKPVADITINDIRYYFQLIQSRVKLAKTTLNNKATPIRSFFQTLYSEEIILKDPSIKLKIQNVSDSIPRVPLTPEELEKLRNACITIREKAFVEFLFSTGCRLMEVINMDTGEINWAEQSAIVHGKGDKYRRVFFSVKCKLYLQEYIKSREGTCTSLFTSETKPYDTIGKSGLERVMRRIASRTDIDKHVFPHLLRHTMATEFLKRSNDITTISRLLGHSHISTTQTYAHPSDIILKSIYDKTM